MSTCGCSNQFPFTYPTFTQPCFPPDNAAAFANEAYRTLTKTPQGQVLVVALGGNAQQFLSAPSGTQDALLVIGTDGQARGTRTPIINLPVLNAPSGGNYPATGSFQYLMVQSSGGNWQVLAAPTSGKSLLQTNGGSWSFVDAGTIPGLDEVGSSGTTVLKGMIVVITEPTTGNFVLNKLRVANKKVVVGDVDGSGNEGFKTLTDVENLDHPKARHSDTLRVYKFVALDAGGNDVGTGLPQAAVTGMGAIADPKRIVYSPTTNLFYLAPANVVTQNTVSLNSAATAPGSSYSSLPGGHGAGISGTYNYDRVRVDFTAGMNASVSNYTTTFALRRDGVVLFEQDNDHNGTVTLFFIDQNVPYGSHTYDIVWKSTSGSGTGPVIKNSNLVTSTLA